jgi:hypothetical protein
MKFLENLKRISIDLIALITIILLMIFVPVDFLPIEAKAGLLSLVVTKFILVSIAVVHAHITRKLMFPYINFATEKDWSNNAMIIAWYIIVIFGWTRGG